MSAPLIYSGRRAKLLTQDGLLRPDGSIIDNNGTPNLIKNGHAEINVTGWTVSKNTSAASRPDSGFVTSSTNITWTRNTTNPIDGQADFLYTKDAANRQGEQVYCGFTVSKKYRAKVLQIEIDYLVNSGTFSAGSSSTDSDIIVYIYDVTNSTFIEPSSFKFLSNSSTIADKFIANFQTSATGSSYRILFHQATTSSSAFAVQFKEVRVSPCQYVYGTPISDWTSYTPSNTQGLGTITSVNLKWRRVGDSMQIQGGFATGTVTGSTAQLGLPSGSTIGGTTSSRMYAGETIRNGGSRVTNFAIQGATYLTFGAGAASHGDVIGSSLFGSSEQLYITAFDIPIAGWSSSTQVSDGYDGRQIVFVGKNSASTSVATTGTYVPFTSQKDSTASWSTDTFTCPSAGDYEVKAGLHGSSTSNYFYAQVDKNGTLYARILQNESRGDRLASGSVIVYNCSAGDTIKLKAYSDTSSQTLNASADLNFITISKLSSPQTMSATEVVAASYTTAAGQSISNSTTDIIDFGTKDFDTHNAVTTGSSWKFTAPISGLYEVSSTILFASSAVTQGNAVDLQVFKNGTVAKRLGYKTIETTFSNFIGHQGSAMVQLNAGDYIDVRVGFNRTGGNTNLHNSASYNHVSIHRIK